MKRSATIATAAALVLLALMLGSRPLWTQSIAGGGAAMQSQPRGYPFSFVGYGDIRFTDPANRDASDPERRQALVRQIAADKPDFVILELGANDALRGLDPVAVRANLDKMIAKIQTSGAKVLLAGMVAPANWGEAYQQAFNRIYPELAEAHDIALYPFVLDGVALDPKLNQPDGLHPNQRGVAIIVEHIAPYVARLMGGS